MGGRKVGLIGDLTLQGINNPKEYSRRAVPYKPPIVLPTHEAMIWTPTSIQQRKSKGVFVTHAMFKEEDGSVESIHVFNQIQTKRVT